MTNKNTNYIQMDKDTVIIIDNESQTCIIVNETLELATAPFETIQDSLEAYLHSNIEWTKKF